MGNPSATTYAACHSTVSKLHETAEVEVVDLEGFGLDFVFTTITRHYSSFPSMLTSILEEFGLPRFRRPKALFLLFS